MQTRNSEVYMVDILEKKNSINSQACVRTGWKLMSNDWDMYTTMLLCWRFVCDSVYGKVKFSFMSAECFKWLKKRPIWWVHWRSNFRNKRCLSRENQSYKVGINVHDFLSNIKHTETVVISSAYSSWIINEFFKSCTIHCPQSFTLQNSRFAFAND